MYRVLEYIDDDDLRQLKIIDVTIVDGAITATSDVTLASIGPTGNTMLELRLDAERICAALESPSLNFPLIPDHADYDDALLLPTNFTNRALVAEGA